MSAVTDSLRAAVRRRARDDDRGRAGSVRVALLAHARPRRSRGGERRRTPARSAASLARPPGRVPSTAGSTVPGFAVTAADRTARSCSRAGTGSRRTPWSSGSTAAGDGTDPAPRRDAGLVPGLDRWALPDAGDRLARARPRHPAAPGRRTPAGRGRRGGRDATAGPDSVRTGCVWSDPDGTRTRGLRRDRAAR